MAEKLQTAQEVEAEFLEWEGWSSRIQKPLILGGNKKCLIQNLSGEELDEIGKIPEPIPPKKYKTDPDGKPLRGTQLGETEPNFDDPSYKDKLEQYNKSRVLKILEFGLVKPDGKSIPGETPDKKWDFIRKGIAGDIFKLSQEIMRLSHLTGEDVDFFVEG